MPSERQDGSSVAAKGDVSGDTELPTPRSPDLHSRIIPEVQELQATPDKSMEKDAVRAKELVNCDTIDESSSAKAISKRQKISPLQQGQGSSPALMNEVQQPQRGISSETPDHKESEQADEGQQPDLKMSTEQQLNVEQTQQLQPHNDDGLNLADRGSPWFLRIDRQA